MNKAYALTLLDESIRTVKCRYTESRNNGKEYTFLTKLELVKGDYVVVPSADHTMGFVVCVVTGVDSIPDIDANATIHYKWVVCKIDLDSYTELLEWSDKASEELRLLVRKRHREQALATLGLTASDLPPWTIANNEASKPTSAEKQRRQVIAEGYRVGEDPDLTVAANPYGIGQDLHKLWMLGYQYGALDPVPARDGFTAALRGASVDDQPSLTYQQAREWKTGYSDCMGAIVNTRP